MVDGIDVAIPSSMIRFLLKELHGIDITIVIHNWLNMNNINAALDLQNSKIIFYNEEDATAYRLRFPRAVDSSNYTDFI